MRFLKTALVPFLRCVHQAKNHRRVKTVGSLLAIGSLLLIAGCSSQESRENFDTLLCWLRPSCLPSQSSSSRSRFPRQAIPTYSPPPCHTTLKTVVPAQKPSITISYLEPTTQIDGGQLTNLAMTTIYQNIGNGFTKTKDVPATSPKGGGKIIETLPINISSKEKQEITICVTSTNSAGQEG